MTSGLRYIPSYFDRAGQEAIVATLEEALLQAPFYRPVMPRSGRPFTVRMSNLGKLGWVSDRAGYRYQAQHPETGTPWPQIPDML